MDHNDRSTCGQEQSYWEAGSHRAQGRACSTQAPLMTSHVRILWIPGKQHQSLPRVCPDELPSPIKPSLLKAPTILVGNQASNTWTGTSAAALFAEQSGLDAIGPAPEEENERWRHGQVEEACHKAIGRSKLDFWVNILSVILVEQSQRVAKGRPARLTRKHWQMPRESQTKACLVNAVSASDTVYSRRGGKGKKKRIKW